MPKQKTSREEILPIAYEVFRQKGYHQTTMSDLAKACDLEKAHFYYYFKDKQALMAAVIAFAHKKMEEWVFSKAYNERYTPEERVEKMLDNLEKILLRHFDGCFMGNTVLETANTEPSFMEAIQQYFNDWKLSFTYIFAKFMPKPDAQTLALEAMKQIQGALIFTRLHRDPQYLVDSIDNIRYKVFAEAAE